MHSWLPEGVSTYSPTIDHMFFLILWVTGVGFVLTEIVLFAFAFRYRRRAGRRATYTHGNGTLEIIWTVVPAVFFVFLGLMSQRAWKSIKGEMPHTDEVVTVTASQFNWEIRYRGVDGQFDTPDDVVMNNEMRLPANVPVKIRLRSKDVIHSFFLPQFRLKQDAVPGLTIEVWLQATKTGEYEIACAELCGFGHYSMRGLLTVVEPADYGTWLKQAEAGVAAAEPAPGAEAKSAPPA
ncbi:MAG TPA: cytochrome c oxidase subunit II [Candidatus Polarisedimenticolia bacterium]|nr:cytochrome c oxidase subunit II [Candidatus Polarisedimenticolia bacterium]